MATLPVIPILADGTSVIGIVGWSLVLIILLLAGFFAVSRLRQWMKNDEPAIGIGFTLSDLRQLHREGKMTDEEFERARSKMMAGAKAMTAKLPDPLAQIDATPPTADRPLPNRPFKPPATGNPSDK